MASPALPLAASPFVFASHNLPKLKARQLAKTFPFLKLSVAQETTARALGYRSWYECVHQGNIGQPSASDQEAGLDVRVLRYYQQASALIAIGITPAEADIWVRGWGLTGHPTLAPRRARPFYYEWKDFLDEFERKKTTEQEYLDEFGYAEYSKYPEIYRPEWICPGVILGPMGKYPHYAVDPVLAAGIPVYLRGPRSGYHCEDGADVLEQFIPGFPKQEQAEREDRLAEEVLLLFGERLNCVQYEWHYGSKYPRAHSDEACLPRLIAAARKQPDDLMVITQRAMPGDENRYEFRRYAVACLRGGDFVQFLENKGVLDTTKVIWFHDLDPNSDCRDFWSFDMWLTDPYMYEGKVVLPVFRNERNLEPGLPLYSYPFMVAPMSSSEYMGGIEYTTLLPLNKDYLDDGGDDDEGDDDDPDGEFDPSGGPLAFKTPEMV